MELFFKELRSANIARQKGWPGNEEADAEFRTLELADEIGEVLGATKKMLRAERGIAGATKTKDDLADEIGDALISLDLMMQEIGMSNLPTIIYLDQDPTECPARLALKTFASAGSVADAFLNIVSQRSDAEVSHLLEALQHTINGLTLHILRLARLFEIDIEQAVAIKFNKTSEKQGFMTRLELAA